MQRSIRHFTRNLSACFLLLSALCVLAPAWAQDLALPPTTPSVNAFDVDLFTGAAVIDLPIAVPPGAGGIKPNIVLRGDVPIPVELEN